jgi:hypothetical protein
LKDKTGAGVKKPAKKKASTKKGKGKETKKTRKQDLVVFETGEEDNEML